MSKQPPILVVNKPRKARKVSSTKKKTSSTRKGKRRKKHSLREIPHWLRVILTICTVVAFSLAFYYFFIRPYAYRWKPCYGCKEYGVCMPVGYEVHGIDISHFQGQIDWQQLSNVQSLKFPISFVFMKATEGGDLKDETFEQNFKSAREHGFIRGAYHFFNPKTSAQKQADFFINTVKLDTGDLPPVLDVEKIGDLNQKSLKAELRIWLNSVEQHYKVRPILYTSYKFKTKYLSDTVFDTYPYWIAHYYVDSVKYQGKWQFWQHTDVGSIKGIPESVDLNIFNGTFDELSQMTIGKNK
ncbi:MAG: glycoside hydrolase family 25 protein [Bacteroidaceae bacterium]